MKQQQRQVFWLTPVVIAFPLHAVALMITTMILTSKEPGFTATVIAPELHRIPF